MAYESRHLRRQKVRYDDTNDDNPLTYQLVIAGAKVTPTSATIQVFDTGGTSRLAATAMTLSTTLLTYLLDTTTEASFPIGSGYRAKIITTANAKTYEDHILFDIAKLVPFGRIGRDQLVALDDRVKAMEHDGDEDFSEIIEAVRDEVQLHIETKVIGEKQLLEDMVLDQSRIAIPSRYLILSRIFREKGQPDDAKYYEDKYNELIDAVMAGVKFDRNQDLQEDSVQGGVQTMRLIT